MKIQKELADITVSEPRYKVEPIQLSLVDRFKLKFPQTNISKVTECIGKLMNESRTKLAEEMLFKGEDQ